MNNEAAIDEDLNGDPFLELLTEALRAGPGTAKWNQAVEQINGGKIDGDGEYAMLIKARENLASGKAYREIRPGAQFTRKLLTRIDADAAAAAQRHGKSPVSASFVSYIGAGLVVGALAMVFFWLTRSNEPGGTEDLSNLFFGTTLISANLDGPLPPGWRLFGPLTVDPAKGLLPSPAGPSASYTGGGIVNVSGLSGNDPFAVEATFEFHHVSDELVPQLFVTDQPDFSSDQATSPHELVWLVREGNAQVALPDHQLMTNTQKIGDGQTVSVRIVVGSVNAVVISDGKVIWSGVSQLSDKPRYVGIRMLRRKDDKRNVVTAKALRVVEK